MPLRIAPLLAVLLAPAVHAQSPLAATLAKLDAASAHFSNAQAAFHNEDYTAVVKDTTTQDGILYSVRKGANTDMGIKVSGSGARTVQYRNGILKDFNGSCFNTVDATRSRSTIDSFLTLAFGTSGKALNAAWNIADLGPETLQSDGQAVKVEKLDLTPKDPGTRNNVTHITLWLDLDRAVSLKLVFYSPSRDTHTATYSKIRLNEKSVDTKPFDIPNKPCR